MGINFQKIFESSPDLYLIMRPDAPRFTIETASDEYLRKAQICREDIVGRGVFEVFPDNPDDANSRGSHDLKLSLQRVLEKKVQDSMAIYKYDIRRHESGGKFEDYYWSTTNIPIIENGEVKYILHRVTDVTELVRSQQKEILHSELTQEFRDRIKLMEKEIMLRAQEVQDTHDRLKTSIQLREDVLAIVSHDLNNPLGTIEMSTELLK
jgi:signal transduction histidine kinase